MLTREEALALVLGKLARMSPADDPFVVVNSDTMERSFGWIFFFNSEKFVETGLFTYRLAGNGPIIVNKFTSAIHVFGTNKPVEQIISEYERQNGERT